MPTYWKPSLPKPTRRGFGSLITTLSMCSKCSGIGWLTTGTFGMSRRALGRIRSTG